MFGVLASLVGSQLFKGIKDAGRRKLLQSGLDSVGSVAGSYFSSEFKRRQQMKLYDAQRSRELENWRMENEYNLPKNQVQRLRDAGLNPALIYSQGAAGNTAGSIGSPGYGGDGLDVFSNILQQRKNDAEIRNIEADTESKLEDANLTRRDTLLREQQFYTERIRTLREDIARETDEVVRDQKKIELKYYEDLQQKTLDNLDSETEKNRADANLSFKQALHEVEKLNLTKQQIETEAARAKELLSQTFANYKAGELDEKRKAEIDAKVQALAQEVNVGVARVGQMLVDMVNTNADTFKKRYELELNRLGINTTNPNWFDKMNMFFVNYFDNGYLDKKAGGPGRQGAGYKSPILNPRLGGKPVVEIFPG